MALVAVVAAPIWAEGPVVTNGQAVRHDTSPPLLEMIGAAGPPSGLSAEVPIKVRPEILDRAPTPGAPDGARQTSPRPFPGAGPTPAPSLSVEGLDENDNIAQGQPAIVPPDVNGDIGLDENGNRIYIQYINLVWAVYDGATGALADGPFDGNSFWSGFGGSCQTNNDGDPVVLYDDLAGQWVFSQFSINQGIQCVAISVDSNPLGPYHRYAFTVTPGGANDYPKMGIFTDGAGQSAYTFTTRDFGGAGGPFSVGAGVMERDKMLVGDPTAQFIKFSNPCTGADCIEGQLPPHLAGPAPPAGTCPTFFTYVDGNYDDSPFGASDGVRNHTLCVDWNNLPASNYTEGPFVSGLSFDRFLGNGFSDCISPVLGGEPLDCLSLFTMYRAQYRWFGSNASVVINTTVDAGGDRGAVRWGELESADGDSAWGFAQEGTYDPDGSDRWMGSIAQDEDGNIALGYAVASGSLFPSVRYTSRMAGDAPGTMPGGEVSCHEGTGAQISSANRWGDYSSMSSDPVDGCTFWYTQEYYETVSSFNWKTRICSFSFPDCGGGGDPPIPCEDFRRLFQICRTPVPGRNILISRVIMRDTSHDGETVTLLVDGVPTDVTINGRTGFARVINATSGTHTLGLADPAMCLAEESTTCP
jgi:hypothetical protein